MKSFFDQNNKKVLFLISLSIIIVLVANLQISLFIQMMVVFLLLFAFVLLLDRHRKNTGNYKQLINGLDLPALLIFNHKITNINTFAVEIFQCHHEEEVVGHSINDYLLLDSGKLMNEKGNAIGEFTNCKGGKLEVELITIKASDHHDEPYLVIINDRSELKEQREKLQQLDQLSSIGELAAGIAHEIRNPITSLKGFLQLIDQSNSSKTAYTEIMLSEIDRINSIVSELLLIAKPRGLILKERNLIQIIQTVITLTSTQAILYNIQIQLNIDKSSTNEILVKCDENKLKQVFINIIKNAIEAMRMEGTILVTVSRQTDFVLINVRDEGDGIPKEKLAKLGKQFFSTKQGGTGLGVMISSKIIEDHGGVFQIESEEGRGTEVRIILPI